jgi:hypothetical protein
MRGQDHREVSLLVHAPQEVADALLGYDVHPDGGLAEVEDLWIVEQRRRQVATHALAQAQLPDRSVEEAIEFREVSEDLQVGIDPPAPFASPPYSPLSR